MSVFLDTFIGAVPSTTYLITDEIIIVVRIEYTYA